MANTITNINYFTSTAIASASEMMNNFGLFRDDVIPINLSVASASTETHNWGTSEYVWKTGYINNISFVGMTSTAEAKIYGHTTDASGMFLFNIAGSIAAGLATTGFTRDSWGILSAANTYGSEFSTVFTTATSSLTFVTLLAQSIKVKGGGYVEIKIYPEQDSVSGTYFCVTGGAASQTNQVYCKLEVYRDLITITSDNLLGRYVIQEHDRFNFSGSKAKSIFQMPPYFTLIDSPPGPTTVTYYLGAYVETTLISVAFNRCKLFVREL